MNSITIPHVYFSYNDVSYLDYDLVLVEPDHFSSYCAKRIGGKTLVSSSFVSSFNNLEEMLDTEEVKEGSSIFTVPNFPVSSEEIRNHYKRKIVPDAGDYNVFSDLKVGRRCLSAKGFILLQDQKKIITGGQAHSYSDLSKTADIIDPQWRNSQENKYDFSYYLSWYTCDKKTADLYSRLLLQGYKKPCIYYRRLNLTNSNELTVDALLLFLKVARTYYREDGAEEKFVLQCGALNQTNWRMYPNLMQMALAIAYGKHNGIIRNIHHQNKTVAEILSNGGAESKMADDLLAAMSDKERQLAYDLVDAFTGIGEKKFCTYSEYCNFMNELCFPEWILRQFYRVDVRIVRKPM